MVFLTGQREVRTLCNWLLKAFPNAEPGDARVKIATSKEDVAGAVPCKAKKRKGAKVQAEARLKAKEMEDLKNLNETEEKSSIGKSPSISRFNLDKYVTIKYVHLCTVLKVHSYTWVAWCFLFKTQSGVE